MDSHRGSSRRGRGSSSSSGRGRGTSSSSRVRRGRGRGRGSYYNRSNGATSNSSYRALRQRSVTHSTASRLTTPNPSINSRQGSSVPSVVYRLPRQPTTSATPSIRRDNFDDNASDETLDEIVMAIDWKPRGTVGCAYYVAAQEKLYFMEDIELGGLDIIEARKVPKDPCPWWSLTEGSENIH